MASEYPASRAGRPTSRRRASPARTTGPRTPPVAPAPRTLLPALRDSLLTGLWTATRDLDGDPRRRRLARGALLVAALPGVLTEWRRTGPAPTAEEAAAPRPLVLGVVGVLAAATLAASHAVESAAVASLRGRGVRHAGSALGAALAVVQLVAGAGLDAAARRRVSPDAGSLSDQAGSTQR